MTKGDNKKYHGIHQSLMKTHFTHSFYYYMCMMWKLTVILNHITNFQNS